MPKNEQLVLLRLWFKTHNIERFGTYNHVVQYIPPVSFLQYLITNSISAVTGTRPEAAVILVLNFIIKGPSVFTQQNKHSMSTKLKAVRSQLVSNDSSDGVVPQNSSKDLERHDRERYEQELCARENFLSFPFSDKLSWQIEENVESGFLKHTERIYIATSTGLVEFGRRLLSPPIFDCGARQLNVRMGAPGSAQWSSLQKHQLCHARPNANLVSEASAGPQVPSQGNAAAQGLLIDLLRPRLVTHIGTLGSIPSVRCGSLQGQAGCFVVDRPGWVTAFDLFATASADRSPASFRCAIDHKILNPTP